MTFPRDFVWGAATSSYQIEGAALEDGRGECIWTRFSHTPGKIQNNDTGDVACKHYHLYKDDIKLMQEIGLQAYRFSVAWSRVIPKGIGETNPAGLDFYDRLVDSLLEANIQPYLTLYHWDLPQALQGKGGWENPDSVQWFADYADLMSKRFGDRVKHWITHNEPWVVAFVGNYYGAHAPGNQDLSTACCVAHHVLLSHGAAVPVIRANVPDAKVGITLDLHYYEPASEKPEDIAACQREDGFRNRWFLDPVTRGEYPADLVEWFGDTLNGIDLAEIKKAQVPIDFLGINYYMRWLVAHASENEPFESHLFYPESSTVTKMGWEVYPEGLKNNLIRWNQEYDIPAFYITENGASFEDDGNLSDPKRKNYYKAHLNAVHRAIEAGVPVKGYFAWSLMDNFEWAFGYAQRFGIVHVDFETQKRTLKDSAKYYARVIQNNAVVSLNS